MPWTKITRCNHDLSNLRHASDCRDEEWKLIAPLVTQRAKVGRPHKSDMREVVNALLYIATTGCQWRQLPKDFRPVSTVRYHFYRMRDDGTFIEISELLSVTREIIKRSDTAKGFQLLPRRWAVERTFAWLGRSRRLATYCLIS